MKKYEADWGRCLAAYYASEKSEIRFHGLFDWNGEGIEKEWLQTILDRITECPQHAFPISKRPEPYDRYRFTYSSNVMLGGDDDWKRIAALRKYKGRKAAPNVIKEAFSVGGSSLSIMMAF